MSENLSDYFYDPKSGRLKRMSGRGRWYLKHPKVPTGPMAGTGAVAGGASAGTVGAVATGGFIGGFVAGRLAVYKDLEGTPRNWVVEATDWFQQTGKYRNNSAPQSSGGKEIQEAEYPFMGGQTNKYYYVWFRIKYISGNLPHNTVQDNTVGPFTMMGPIVPEYRDSDEKGWQVASNEWEMISTKKLFINNIPWSVNFASSKGEIAKVARVERVDGSSQGDDISEGGNLEPTKEKIITNNITNNVTNITNNHNNYITQSNTNTNDKNPQGVEGVKNPSTPDTNNSEDVNNKNEKNIKRKTGKGNETSKNKSDSPTFVPVGVPYLATPNGATTAKKQADNLRSSVPTVRNTTSTGTQNNNNTATNRTPVTSTQTKRENTTGEPQPNNGGCCIPAILPNMDLKLNGLNALLNGAELGLLTIINNKMGAQLTGGLSGFLKKAWLNTAIDKAVNYMTLVTTLHNAGHLSRNLADTLTQIIDNGLAIVGIKDFEGNPIDVSSAIGNTASNILKSIIGESNYTGLTTQWKIASTIYNSSINIYQQLEDSVRSLKDALEIIGKYNTDIGNALKRDGIVDFDSYDWMAEEINFDYGGEGKLRRLIKGLETATDVAEDIERLTGEVRNSVENVNQIITEYNQFQAKIDELTTEKETDETERETNSESPDITKSDRVPPKPED